jgi:thiol:disulfide interchange protein
MLGLALPFVLGLGMALPWPFAGAGLSFLPKPGAWMVKVKYGFGMIIFGFAAWYGYVGLGLSGEQMEPVRWRGAFTACNKR